MKNTVTAALLVGALCLLAVAGTGVAAETIGVVRAASGDATVTRGTRFAVKVGEPSSR